VVRRTTSRILLFSAAAVCGSLLYFYFDPSYSRYFPPCPFYSVTGIFCPGCGSQRAFHDLLHANVTGAADHNLLFVIAVPFILFSVVVTVNNLFHKKKMQQSLFYKAAFARAVLVCVLGFWIMRNIPLAPFTWLAP